MHRDTRDNVGEMERTLSKADLNERVRYWLRTYGCGLATDEGVDLARSKRPVEWGIVGILYGRTPPPAKRWFHLLFPPRKKRYFLGVLSFFERDAKHTSPWCFEVYGREHLREAQRLAEALSSAFDDTPIYIDLALEKPLLEELEEAYPPPRGSVSCYFC